MSNDPDLIETPPSEQCPRCEGCGQIANSDEGEPWTFWMDLPVKSAMAVTLGLVRPVACPQCDGEGQL